MSFPGKNKGKLPKWPPDNVDKGKSKPTNPPPQEPKKKDPDNSEGESSKSNPPPNPPNNPNHPTNPSPTIPDNMNVITRLSHILASNRTNPNPINLVPTDHPNVNDTDVTMIIDHYDYTTVPCNVYTSKYVYSVPLGQFSQACPRRDDYEIKFIIQRVASMSQWSVVIKSNQNEWTASGQTLIELPGFPAQIRGLLPIPWTHFRFSSEKLMSVLVMRPF